MEVQVVLLLCVWSAYHYYSDNKIQLKWKKSQQFSLTTNQPSPCFPMILVHPVSIVHPPHSGPLFGATPGSCLCYRAFFLHSPLSDEFISLTYQQHLLKGSIENFIALPKFPARRLRTLLNTVSVLLVRFSCKLDFFSQHNRSKPPESFHRCLCWLNRLHKPRATQQLIISSFSPQHLV